VIRFDEENHRYTYNGKPVVSVTQVMSRVGVRETEEAPFRPVNGFMGGTNNLVLQTASQFGKALHLIAEWVMTGKTFEFDPQMEPWVASLLKFKGDFGNDLEIIATEKLAYSKIYGYAGTMDLYGLYKGSPIIIDWKSSTTVSKTWNLQTAAYEQLIKEETGIKKNFHRWAVQVKENGYYIEKRLTEKQDFNRFLSLLNVYKTFI
jgi:hypothetical protein